MTTMKNLRLAIVGIVIGASFIFSIVVIDIAMYVILTSHKAKVEEEVLPPPFGFEGLATVVVQFKETQNSMLVEMMTKTPTRTLVPSPTPTLTFTPTSTSSPTPVPTLVPIYPTVAPKARSPADTATPTGTPVPPTSTEETGPRPTPGRTHIPPGHTKTPKSQETRQLP